MAWDASRQVPWLRLLRDAAIFLTIGVVVFALVLDDSSAASYVGLVIGMLFFVGFSALLAKFGYQRQTLRELRAGSTPAARPAAASTPPRHRPPATQRTSTGPSQRRRGKRR